MKASALRVVVIGAGPIGIAAAMGARECGHDVVLLERGSVGASLRRWGETPFFSPLAANLPPGAERLLGARLPRRDAMLTGPAFVDEVLLPLAATDAIAPTLRIGHRVVGVSRRGMSRGDFPGHPVRGERPFRLLVDTAKGEHTVEADAVLDASGTFGNALFAGAGGLPAVGERALAKADGLIRDLGTLWNRREDLAQRRVLLVGHGHSAAHAIGILADLAGTSPATRIVWAVRSAHLRPCIEVASDPLPLRSEVTARANGLAAKPPAWLRIERKAQVEAFTRRPDGAVEVLFAGPPPPRRAEVDAVVALTGTRPDLSFLSELALSIGPVTEGAAGVERALANVTDCLSAPRLFPHDLASGEPGFFLVGQKSYGRARTFLLRNGYAEVGAILGSLGVSR